MGTMTDTLHAPEQNGFHDVQNGHMDLQNRDVDLEQWLGQVDPRKSVHCGMWEDLSHSAFWVSKRL
jgi:hypothetical protein